MAPRVPCLLNGTAFALAPPLLPEWEVAQEGKQPREVWAKLPGESLPAQGSVG